MLFENRKFYVKIWVKKLAFLQFFLVLCTSKKQSKKDIVSRFVLATPTSVYGIPHTTIPPNNTEMLTYHPTASSTFLPWWFVISVCIKLIQIESGCSYDRLL